MIFSLFLLVCKSMELLKEEGDEQLDQPNSQTCVEHCHACSGYFYPFVKNKTAYHLARYSLHLLLFKSSMVRLSPTP